MKKFTLLFVATLFSALSFAALNPFAYGLSSSLNADQTELTVNYKLNATATDVNFVLMDGSTEIKTVNLKDKGLVKGSYTATVALDDPNMPLGKELSWKIEVKGNSVASPTEHPTNYAFYHPSSVDIDNNPENETFGLILANEAMQSVVSKTSGYVSAGFGAGIFAFSPAFEPMPNGDKPGYNGGITFTTTRADGSGTAYSPRRIRISEDGRIFVTSLNTDGTYLWEVDPTDMNKWTPVFKGANINANKEVVDASDNFMVGPNAGFDVRGSGKDLKLMMYTANLNGIKNAAFAGFTCAEYNLGTKTEWTTTPSKTWISGKYAVSYTGTQVEYDKEGGIWMASNRGSSTDKQPGLVHFNANGVEDYKQVVSYVANAGIRFNKDFTKLVVAGVKEGSANPKKATVYTISKDAEGKPVLTQEVVINMATVGTQLNDFAFDYAGNLFALGNNAEKIVAWAMPYSGTVATPCASQYAFTINSAAQMAKASELNPYAYDLSSELSDNKKTLIINYSLNANATAVKAIIMEGDTEVKTVACTGITRGNHTVEIPTTDLPVGPKYTWKIKVDGTSKSVPTKVSTEYSLWGPYGLDIDKNPESEYFGRILATESYHGAKDLSGYLSTGQGGGLYVFTPDFATDGKVRTGEVNFTRKLASKGFQPFRVRISEDGRIFVTSLDINGVAVWEVSKDLQTWTPLLAGTNNSSDYRIYYNTSTFLAAPNASIDVTGTGDNLKLLLYSASKDAISAANQKWFRLDEYAMNGVETGETFPTSNTHKAIKAFNGYNLTAGSSTTYKYGVAYNQSAVIYDGEGGYWFAGSRGNNVATEPNLAHVNASGVQDYYNTSDQMLGGAGILIHNHSIKGKVLIKGTKPAGTFKVYALGKNADGTPKLDEIWTVTSGIGTNHNAFAVDYAENLYVVGNNKEKIFAFALPYSGSVTTPCAAKYAFELEAHGVVKRAVQLGESTIVLTHEADGTPYIYNVVGDVMTPISQNGIVARDPENAGDYLAISDIAVTEDGKLVACNYIMCQSDASKVDAGYKRGESRFYIWDNLNANPRVWFTSKMYSNWYRSKQGYTMALKGTSTNAQIFTTGANGTNNKARFSIYNVKNGIYTEPTSNTNDYYHYHNGASDINTVDMTTVLGANYELNASPWDNMWIIDGNLIEPYEVNVSTTNNVALTKGEALAQGTLGKKYNGATYFTIGNLCFMVAPYADASGKVAGVKLIEIHNGLASAKVVQTLDLATPVTGTAAATAVKVDGFDLTITLVVDADIYTFNTSIELDVTIAEDADNTTALVPYVGESVAATVTRQFTPNKCYTLTLPFDMSATQISSVFGTATVYEFTKVTAVESELYLEFSRTSSITAGKPYLIQMPTTGGYDAVDGFTIEDVTISTTLNPVTIDGITMVPVLDAGETLDQANQYYVSNAALYSAQAYPQPISGLRAYFTSSSPTPIRARVVFEENTTTSIPMVDTPTKVSARKVLKNGRLIIIRGEEQYNIQGQRVD